MTPEYKTVPILDAARRAGVRIADGQAGRYEVKAFCPFCLGRTKKDGSPLYPCGTRAHGWIHITGNVVDNERQREKMSHEFYVALKKEIETYQERASHLINTRCESPAIMARWVSKICELGEKRRRYEDLFQRQISEVDGEFNTLQGFARELQVRIDHAHLKPLRPCA